MKNRYVLFSLLFAQLAFAQSVEQVTVMCYNLLNYRLTTSYCTGANNSATAKDGYLKTITQYTDPDLFVCNEIGSNPANADDILTKVLNVDGVTHYAQANYSNNGSSSLVNMLFYNTTKFGLHSQYTVTHDLNNAQLVRVLDIYRMYYKDPLLGTGGDTVYLSVVAAHLKAGDTPTDEADRAKATAALMTFLNTYPDDNVVLCGDLNMKSGLDAAFQNLINWSNAAERFYDPVSSVGNWNNNGIYASYHTQSTRTSNTNSGCFSGGGLDDRFDHILLSDAVLNGTGAVSYVNGTFQVIGNNGSLLNNSVDATSNLSVPSNVRTALYEMSDHLPLRVYLEIQKLGLGSAEHDLQGAQVRVVQPIQDVLDVRINHWKGNSLNLELLDLTGKRIRSWQLQTPAGKGEMQQSLAGIPGGIYLLRLQGNTGEQRVLKLVKQ